MPRCPTCGAWFWVLPHPADEHHDADKKVCPKCGAVIISQLERRSMWEKGPKEILRPIVIGYVGEAPQSPKEPGEITLTETEAREKWKHDHPEYYSPIAICIHCKATITVPNARFCPMCGADLKPLAEHVTPQTKKAKLKAMKRIVLHRGQAERCSVCGLELTEKDNVAWCVHCGNLAHRNHLIDWLNKKKTCPICGEYLNPGDYE